LLKKLLLIIRKYLVPKFIDYQIFAKLCEKKCWYSIY